MTPNIDIRLTTASFILAASIAVAYFSHVGWWAIAGLTYFVYARLDNDILEHIVFLLSVIFFIVAILKMGWVFS